jgi:Putative collagen-binding domain of a collagenase
MQYVRNLMLSRPMLSRIPDQSMLQDAFSGADHIQATRGDGYAFIYAATGKPFTLNLGKITGSTVVGWWFDPRNGTATPIAEYRRPAIPSAGRAAKRERLGTGLGRQGEGVCRSWSPALIISRDARRSFDCLALPSPSGQHALLETGALGHWPSSLTVRFGCRMRPEERTLTAVT